MDFGLKAVVPILPEAAEPFLIPVPAAGVKVLPRWAEEDEVLRWRLKYREHQAGEPDRTGASIEDGKYWVELELRPFTRELPLTGLRHSHALFQGCDRDSRWMVKLEPHGQCRAAFAWSSGEARSSVCHREG